MEKKKVLKIVLIIIAVFVVIIVGYFLRNYIIIRKLSKMGKEINNYSIVAEYHSETNTTEDYIYEVYYKDGIYKETLSGEGCNYTKWINDKSNEQINIDHQNLTYSIINTTERGFRIYPFLGFDMNNMFFKISNGEVNGEKCYILDGSTKDYPLKIYISKENGQILKDESGTRVLEYKNYKLNKVTDDIVEKPDLIGYTNSKKSE